MKEEKEKEEEEEASSFLSHICTRVHAPHTLTRTHTHDAREMICAFHEENKIHYYDYRPPQANNIELSLLGAPPPPGCLASSAVLTMGHGRQHRISAHVVRWPSRM